MVFNDLDQDGQRDAGEPRLGGWTVYIDSDENGQHDLQEPTAVTDGQGSFSFTEVEPHGYTVTVLFQEGWASTQPAGGTQTVVVAPGQILTGADFGVRALAGGVHGALFHDLDSDGFHDAEEPGLENWQVYVDQNSNGQFDVGEPYDLTDADGIYSLLDLASGIHRLAYLLQDGWQFTQPSSGARYVSVGPGQSVPGIDFGSRWYRVDIRGTKWCDVDGDGLFEAGEPAMAGATVYLDLNRNRQFDPGEPATVTRTDDPTTPDIDETGTYCFAGLDPGEYTVAEIVPVGYEATYPPVLPSTGKLSFVEVVQNGQNGVEGLDEVYSVAVSPDGAHVYAAGYRDAAVAVLRRDAQSGELTFVQVLRNGQDDVYGLTQAAAVTLSPGGNHVYVAAYGDNAVAVFRRDTITGELSFVQTLRDGEGGVDGLWGAGSVAVSLDDNHVYVLGNKEDTLAAFNRDPTTGELTPLQVLKDNRDGVDGLNSPWSLALSPDDRHVYVASQSDDSVATFRRDVSSGELTFVQILRDGQGGVDGLNRATAVTVSPDGNHVYVAGYLDAALAVFQRDTLSGELTFVQTLVNGQQGVDGLSGVSSVTVSPDGTHVYTAGSLSDAVAVFQRNPLSGELTFVEVFKDGQQALDGLDGALSIAISPDGAHLYIAGRNDDTVAVFCRDARTARLHELTVAPGQVVTDANFGSRPSVLYWDEQGDGRWDDPTRWLAPDGQPASMSPDATSDVVIRNGTITVPAALTVRNLTIENGSVQLQPGAVLTVEENVEFAPDATLVCQIDGSAYGRIDAGGTVELGGALEIQPVGVAGAALGSIRTQTIITAAGGVLGQFDSVPPVHGFRRGPSGHLGIGVFHKGTDYVDRLGPNDPASAVDVDLFFAGGGDSNGDGYVNGLDLNIVYCHMTQPGDPADRSWVLGDTAGGPIGRGDGYVDQADLDALRARFTCGCIGGHVQTPAPIVVEEPAEVVQRHVFYNNSAFDGHDSGAGIGDDAAIADDKAALRPGEMVSAANYTNYHRGINGLMIDVDGLPEGFAPAAGDFLFLTGNDDLPGGWTAAPAPAEVVLREGAGDDGSDRITIIWDDYAIQNQWLEVTVLAERLGLAGDDVFYLGNAVGETGNSPADARVTVADLLLTRNNPRGILEPAGIDCPYDFNRDGRVNATDVLLARNNQTSFANALELLDLSVSEPS
ncbi:MAG TPA: beta-propeller fold lactonase family protein, partial [Thermoguttaceae bacterium]|nr:beta-propeller fold lactonase family protein [Thermoguttaceae bacterium]